VTAGRVLDVARSQLGTVEDAKGRTKYSAAYDPALNGQAWCAMFTWWVFREAGDVGLIPKAAYTPTYWQWFVSRGQGDRKPRPGDLVFYNWPDSVNRVQHVGIVEAVNADGTITTIEGNTTSGQAGDQSNGGGVWRRRRSQSAVVGYGHPKYGAAPAAPAAAPRPGAVLATLQRGMKNDQRVRRLQEFLNRYPWRPELPLLPTTGNYLEQTVDVVRRAQAQCGVTGPDADGTIVGPRTSSAFASRGASW
jgi:hypothetical protein